MKGQQIQSVDELIVAAKNKRSVCVYPTRHLHPNPAAFILNQSALRVHDLIRWGLFLYETPKKRKLFKDKGKK